MSCLNASDIALDPSELSNFTVDESSGISKQPHDLIGSANPYSQSISSSDSGETYPQQDSLFSNFGQHTSATASLAYESQSEECYTKVDTKFSQEQIRENKYYSMEDASVFSSSHSQDGLHDFEFHPSTTSSRSMVAG